MNPFDPPDYLNEAPPPQEPEQDDPVLSWVGKLNSKFCIVNENGNAVIFQKGYDSLLRRRVIYRLSVGSLKVLYGNQFVQIGENAKTKEPKFAPVAAVWLAHARRRQFINGVIFDPSRVNESDGVLNLWEGFSVTPVKGNWSLMKDHIRVNVCREDQVKYDYLMGWIASMFQNPACPAEVAVVMRGKRGTGKGTLAKVLHRMIGHHAMAISNPKHLTGNFNAHLRDCIFLFADEAFFAGDKAHIGVLQSIITEPTITIERKGVDAVDVPNFLHIIMASNETWVVPAGMDERRYFVLDVADLAKGNHGYFRELLASMDAGGYQAMMYDLMNMDLSEFNIRDVPNTDGLKEQKKLSLSLHVQWWADCLQRGYIYQSKIGLHEKFGIWHDRVTTELLHKSYMDFAARRGSRHLMSKEALGAFMVSMGCHYLRLQKMPIGEEIREVVVNSAGETVRKAAPIIHPRPSGYAIGPLDTSRQMFNEFSGLAIVWEAPNEDEEPAQADFVSDLSRLSE